MTSQTYPALPLAIVNWLAQAWKERASQENKRIVTIAAHSDKNVNFHHFEMEEAPDGNLLWDPVFSGIAQITSGEKSDTMMIAYPTRKGEGEVGDGTESDACILLRPHQPPQFFSWRWKPEFNLYHLEPEDEVAKQISKGAGVNIMQGILNKEHPQS